MHAFSSYRPYFVQLIEKEMRRNKKIWIITGDLGFRLWDEVRQKHPDRFINVGAAEQAMMGVGVGLALSNQIPFLYSITPFLLYRPFETVRNYVNHEKIPVKLLGVGRNRDYQNEGFSHWAEEDKKMMKLLPNIQSYWPNSLSEIEKIVPKMIHDKMPYYLNFKK